MEVDVAMELDAEGMPLINELFVEEYLLDLVIRYC